MSMIHKKYTAHKNVIENFLWRVLQICGKQIVVFLVFTVCSRLLTPLEFGKYNYILAGIFFLMIFCDFGISTATGKYVAEWKAIDPDRFKIFIFNGVILVLLLSTIVLIVTIAVFRVWFPENSKYLLFAIPLVIFYPLTALYDGIYRGMQRFKELSIITIVVGTVSAVLMVFFVKIWGVNGALFSQGFFYFILFAVLFIKHKEFLAIFDIGVIKEISKYSFVLGVSNVAYYLYTRMDVIILGQFGFVKEVSYYEIVNQIFLLTLLPFRILAQVMAPVVTGLMAQRKIDVIVAKHKKSRMMIPFAVVFTLAIYLILPCILDVVYKKYSTPEMLQAFSILIFVLPIKIWGVYQTQAFIVATGEARLIARATVIGGILNVIMDCVCIYLMGYIGVFVSTVIVHIGCIMVVDAIYSRRLSSMGAKI